MRRLQLREELADAEPLLLERVVAVPLLLGCVAAASHQARVQLLETRRFLQQPGELRRYLHVVATVGYIVGGVHWRR